MMMLQEAPTEDMIALLQSQQAARSHAAQGGGAPVSLEHAAVAALAASSYDLQVIESIQLLFVDLSL